MKSLFFPLREAALLVLLSSFLSISNAQQVSYDCLSIIDYYKDYYDNVVDTSGNILFDEQWNVIMRLPVYEKFLGIKFLSDAQPGYKPTYDAVPSEFALLSPDGTKIVLEYEDIADLHRGPLSVKTDEGWRIIDRENNWMCDQVFKMAPIVLGNYIIFTEPDSISKEDNYQWYGSDWGLMDFSGNILAPAGYSGIWAFDWWEEIHFVLMEGDSCSLIDSNGAEVIPMGNHYIYPSLVDESAWVLSPDGNKVFYPARNKWITGQVKDIYTGLYGCNSGFELLDQEEGYPFANWFCRDQQFRIYNDPESVKQSYKHPYLRIEKDGKFGVISKSGKTILPCIYDNIYDRYSQDWNEHSQRQCVFEGMISVEFDGAWGLIDTSGRYHTHLIYEELQGVSEGIAAAKVKGKSGFIDINGKTIVPFVFDRTNLPWKYGAGRAQLGGSEFLVNRSGKIIASQLGEEEPGSIQDLRNQETFTDLDEWLQYFEEDYEMVPEEENWVNVVGMGLTYIPDLVDNFPNMQYLDMPDNYISYIGRDLTAFPKLEQIELSGNQFTEFPMELLEISGLKHLSIGLNKIREIPARLFQHPNLAEFNIPENSLESIPEIPSPNKKLLSLGLDDNAIRSIPSSITNLKKLQHLYLGGNMITELPPEIAWMKKLRILELQGNKLKNLPDDLSGLKSLVYIDISNNQISSIPESLLKLPKLRRIFLKGNPISEEEIDRIMNIRPDLEIDPV